MNERDRARFWAKVRPGALDECWIWNAATQRGGYGSIWWDNRLRPAHRVAYEMVVGPIGEGLHIDHLCRTPACVNPFHLEPVTQAENTRRGANYNAAKTHCKYGHELTADNVYVRNYYKGRPGRQCRTCAIRNARTARARQEAA